MKLLHAMKIVRDEKTYKHIALYIWFPFRIGSSIVYLYFIKLEKRVQNLCIIDIWSMEHITRFFVILEFITISGIH